VECRALMDTLTEPKKQADHLKGKKELSAVKGEPGKGNNKATFPGAATSPKLEGGGNQSSFCLEAKR